MKRIIPILPVNNVVFFPHTVLPMYVVEPIYANLIKNLIEHDAELGVANAEALDGFLKGKPGTEHFVSGIGRPMILEEMEDGSLRIIVKGCGRVVLNKLVQNLPYLLFESEDYFDHQEQNLNCSDKIERLTELLHSWLEISIQDSVEREAFYKSLHSIYHITDYISLFLVQDPEIRQMLLNNNSIFERIHLLNSLLPGDNPSFEDIFVSNAMKYYEDIEHHPEAVAH